MKNQFKQCDEVVRLLVCADREEAARLRKSYLSRMKQVELACHERIMAMKGASSKDIRDILDKVGNAYSAHPNWPSNKILV